MKPKGIFLGLVLLVVTATLYGITSPPIIGFKSITQQADGSMKLIYTNSSGTLPYTLWATNHVPSSPVIGYWTQLTNGYITSGIPVTFIDTQASNFTQRFYIISVQ